MFALILGIALVVGGERYKNILLLLQELLEISLMIVGWIMRLAPLGIMALLINLAATQDMALIKTLGFFVAVVIGTTLVHGVIALPLILYLVTGVTPLQFWRGAREALITAFATSSSSATLPVTLRCVEQHLHVKRDIAGFVVPLEGQRGEVSEFLLVPYFGACIHTPPPNQIIHVNPAQPLKSELAADAGWVSGVIETLRSDTGMGSAGYRMRAESIVPYRNP